MASPIIEPSSQNKNSLIIDNWQAAQAQGSLNQPTTALLMAIANRIPKQVLLNSLDQQPAVAASFLGVNYSPTQIGQLRQDIEQSYDKLAQSAFHQYTRSAYGRLDRETIGNLTKITQKTLNRSDLDLTNPDNFVELMKSGTFEGQSSLPAGLLDDLRIQSEELAGSPAGLEDYFSNQLVQFIRGRAATIETASVTTAPARINAVMAPSTKISPTEEVGETTASPAEEAPVTSHAGRSDLKTASGRTADLLQKSQPQIDDSATISEATSAGVPMTNGQETVTSGEITSAAPTSSGNDMIADQQPVIIQDENGAAQVEQEQTEEGQQNDRQQQFRRRETPRQQRIGDFKQQQRNELGRFDKQAKKDLSGFRHTQKQELGQFKAKNPNATRAELKKFGQGQKADLKKFRQGQKEARQALRKAQREALNKFKRSGGRAQRQVLRAAKQAGRQARAAGRAGNKLAQAAKKAVETAARATKKALELAAKAAKKAIELAAKGIKAAVKIAAQAIKAAAQAVAAFVKALVALGPVGLIILAVLVVVIIAAVLLSSGIFGTLGFTGISSKGKEQAANLAPAPISGYSGGTITASGPCHEAILQIAEQVVANSNTGYSTVEPACGGKRNGEFVSGGSIQCFDCSGFVRWSFAQLTGTSYGQLRTASSTYNWCQAQGLMTDVSNAKPGDVLLWLNPAKKGKTASHVAFFVSQGDVIDSAGSKAPNDVRHRSGNYTGPLGACDICSGLGINDVGSGSTTESN